MAQLGGSAESGDGDGNRESRRPLPPHLVRGGDSLRESLSRSAADGERGRGDTSRLRTPDDQRGRVGAKLPRIPSLLRFAPNRRLAAPRRRPEL